ncbi:MAG: DUF2793 domain-containing protein [Amaricoccus sp.]|uniref:DUF2793 domain-containing protein n=1 Tax=Amaricoccus sp. TaxID=1872485 RepID=UPI0039E389CD
MPSTAQLSLPLVMPAQAQKHVTVNQALAILDTVTQLRVNGSNTSTPPDGATGGDAYIVPAGATGAWVDQADSVAVWSNGGWTFLEPRHGWRAWDVGLSGWQLYDGTAWVPNALAVSAGGARIVARVLEFDHQIAAGATNLTTVLIPAGAQVLGISSRVEAALTGTALTGWRIGVAGSDNRYGSGLGLARNAYLAGLSGSPVTYYAATPLLLSAEGGTFSSGTVRLAVHLVEISPPRAV